MDLEKNWPICEQNLEKLERDQHSSAWNINYVLLQLLKQVKDSEIKTWPKDKDHIKSMAIRQFLKDF